jgi:hypothetical protein
MTSLREAWVGVFAALVVAVAGVLAACSTPSAPRFPHLAHLERSDCGGPGQPECLRCNGCHSPSQPDRPHKLPDAGVCDRCHRDDRAEVHRVLAVKPARRSGEITFDHSRHLGLAQISGQCVPCHAGVVKGGSTLPPMSQCFTCHEHQEQWDRSECTPCHDRKELSHTLPRTFVKHEGSFARNHGDVALRQGKLCASCHAQAECDDCHDVSQNMSIERRRPEAVDRSFVHRGDFMVRHAIDAQSEPAKCTRCHEPATCDACHVERGVSGNRTDARNPHPFGWVGNDPSVRSLHAREARRDIVLCAGCHEQGPATNCIRCHKVGGYGGNPHPGGWRSSRSTSDEMCRYCHE